MKVGSIYQYLHLKLLEHSKDKIISKDRAIDFLSYYNLPKLLREHILIEMQGYNLLRLNEDRIRLINCKDADDIQFKSRMTRRKKYEERALKLSPNT